MKNKLFYVAVLMMSVCFSTYAQPEGDQPPPPLSKEKKDRVEALKVAFITQRLDLTSEEAKIFWPVYNQYSNELDQLRMNRFKEIRSMNEKEEKLTEKDYEKIVNSEIEFKQNELDIMRKYQVQLKEVISMEKLAKLYKAENDFKRELLKQIKERGDGPPQNKRPGRR